MEHNNSIQLVLNQIEELKSIHEREQKTLKYFN